MERGFQKGHSFKPTWIDLLGEVRTGAKKESWTIEPYRDTLYEMAFLRHDQDNKLIMDFQMPHGFYNASVVIHAHAIPMAPVGGDLYWEHSYYWGNVGEELPVSSGWIHGTGVIPIVGADYYKPQVVDILLIENIHNAGIGSILRMYMIRKGTDVRDTYNTDKDHGTGAANMGLNYLDAHILIDRFGTELSEEPFIKP